MIEMKITITSPNQKESYSYVEEYEEEFINGMDETYWSCNEHEGERPPNWVIAVTEGISQSDRAPYFVFEDGVGSIQAEIEYD